MKTKLKSFARHHTKGLLACLVAVSLVVAQIPISYAVDELNQLAEEQQAAVAEQAAPESVAVAPDEAEKSEPAEEPAKAEQPKDKAEEVTESTDSAESTEGQSDPADQQSPAADSDEPVAGATDTAAADQGKEDLGLVEETVSKKVVDAVTYGSNINIPRVVAEQPEGPAHEKKLEANGDGTYKLSLSVTGKSSSSSESTLADVVVVFDVSGSMSETSNGQTRLAVAKSAVNNLAEQLLANNTAGQENVTLSLVKFSNGASTQIKQTSNLNSFKSAVNGLKADGGTNWEAGLQAAANIGPRGNAKKYVIFVSDGDPTFRTTESGSGFDRATHEPGTKGRNCCNDAKHHDSDYDNAYGTGNSDPHGWNYQAALNVAKPMTNGGADLYCVAAFGNVSNMSKFNGAAGGSGFYEATNQAALNQAFAEIITKISNTATYKNIQITDKVTGLTGVDPNSFEYTLSNGQKYTGGKATYDANTGTVTWNLGEDYKVENGVTATLSFTVWPKQEAYDLVAALNNGEMTYESLTEEQEAQIVKDGNGYALKTNKPSPTLIYTQELTKTVNGSTTVTTQDGKGTFTNPEPMPLDVAKMTVQKKWADSSNNSARPDSIELVITQDGKHYKTVTLSEKNGWKQTVYVAPGLLVKGNAHGATNGTLEPGHTYAIQEPDLDAAYELSTSAIQPMLNGLTTGTTTDMVDALNGNKAWDSTLTATNTVKGSIEVHKKVVGENGQDLTDETVNTEFSFKVTLTQDGKPATGDVVVYNADGSVAEDAAYAFNNGEATVQIKASQYFVVKNVPTGATYTVLEEQQPFGFGFQEWTGANGKALTGTMKGNTKVQATCVNAVQETIAYQSADLKIQKIDEQTGKALSNVTFTLTPGADGTEFQSVTTGEAGAAAFNFTGEGTYTLTETTPAGYVESNASWTIKVAKGTVQEVKYNGKFWESIYDLVFGVDPSSTFDGKTNTLTVKNTQKTGTVSVHKFDGDVATHDVPLSGAVFKVEGTTAAGDSFSKEMTTGADGNASIDGVPFGTYTLTEVTAPQGYSISAEPKEFTIGAGNVDALETFKVANSQVLGSVVITKQDATTKALLAGAEFQTTVNGKAVTAKDNGDGTYTFTDLPFGTYSITETKAPQGYQVAEVPDVTVDAKTVCNEKNVPTLVELTVLDPQKTATVSIEKLDAQTKQPLAGAEFTLEGEDSTGKPFQQTVTTDVAGEASFANVPFGEYTLTETKAPAGYEITFEPQDVVVDAKKVEGFFAYTATNDQLTGTVTVAKTDAQTGKALAGAEFTLEGEDSAGNAYKNVMVTNAEGAVVFSNVPFGTYTLTESKVPQGYTSTFDGKQFELNAQNITEAVKVDVTNDQKTGTLELTKVDAQTKKVLAGAEFQLAGKTAAGKSYSQTLVTGADGLATLDQIPFGTYTLTETKAPAGYQISFQPQELTFNAANIDEAQKVTALDGQKTGTVTVKKIDAQTQEPLAGATFTLVGTTETNTQVDMTAKDKGDGNYAFVNVPFGTYKLTETAAPQGYEVTFEAEDVTINAANVEQGLAFTASDDQKTGSVNVTKLDAQTKSPLAGAEFTLAGQTVTGEDFVKTLTTNVDGMLSFTDVPFGDYELTETKAPAGYLATFTAKAIAMNAQTVENGFWYEVTNAQKEGTVAVTKVDEVTGAKLAGATFELQGESVTGQTVAMTATTGANGVATFANVPFGTYTLTETVAPAGYEVSVKPQTVTIDAANVEETLEFTVEDQQKTGSVTVTKLDEITKAKLPGAEFALTGTSEADEAVTLTSKDNGDGTYTFENVPFGTYQVTETKAPKGYNVTFEGKQITVNAANVENGIQLSAEDQQQTGTVAVTKLDEITKAKLAGAEFALTGTNNAGQTVSMVAITSEDGVATFTKVPFGDYVLTETKAPAGYKISFQGKQFTMDAATVGKTVEFTVEDQQKTGTVTVTKTDDYTNAKLTGAEFALTGTSEADEAVTLTSKDNGDGTYTFANVPFGTYEVTETKAPKGYQVTFEGEDVTVNAANVEAGVAVDATDKQKTASVVVTKADETTSEFLDGAEFTLEGKDSKGEPVKFVQTTNAEGKTTFEGVPFGTYTLTESKAPTGYKVSFDPATVKVDASNVEGDFVYAVTDQQKSGTVSVTKVDEVTNAKLAGATFMLKGETSGKVELSMTASDNGDGTYTFANVPFGTYQLVETAAPKGYLVSFEGTQVVVDRTNVENKVAYTTEVADAQKTGTVTVSKTDEMTGDELTGATFTLTGTSEADEAVTLTSKDNGDGIYTFENVPFGTYTVAETAAPQGYQVTFEGEEVTINAANVEEGVNVDVTDKQKTGTVKVVKTDEATGQLLAGAEFKLVGHNLANDEVEMTATTGEDGVALFANVPFGIFQLTETAAPQGYDVTFEGAEFSIDAQNVENEFAKVIDVTDKQKTTTVTLTKTDAEDQALLAGAVFKLTGKTFAPVAGNEASESTDPTGPAEKEEGVVDQIMGSLATILEGEEEPLVPLYDYQQTATDNGDGTYTFTNVPFGTFTLTEEAAPQGYEISFPATELIINAANVQEEHSYSAVDERTKVSVPVAKEWVDGDDRYQVRPAAVTVNLLADGEQIASAQLNQANEWSTVFEGLDAYKDHGAEAIDYTIEEEAVDHYVSEVDGSVEDGFQVTNTLIYSDFQGDEGDDDDANDDVRKRKVLSDEGKKSAPQTGDYAPIAGVAALAGVCMLGIALIERRKRNMVAED